MTDMVTIPDLQATLADNVKLQALQFTGDSTALGFTSSRKPICDSPTYWYCPHGAVQGGNCSNQASTCKNAVNAAFPRSRPSGERETHNSSQIAIGGAIHIATLGHDMVYEYYAFDKVV